MGISSLWQSQLQPLALTWSHHLKTACHFPVNLKFILLYKVGRKKNPKSSSTCFMSDMSMHIYIFLNRYKMWRLLALQFTSSPLWWNSSHVCLKCWASNLVFKLTALTSEFSQPFLMDWKQESAFMISQPTTLSRSVKYGVLFGAEGKDLMRPGSRRFCSSSQRLKISFP